MLKCMTRRKMMQQKQNRLHRHRQAAPPHMSATRLFMPVLLNLMRIVLQTAISDDNVDSLSSLAPIANKLAITPINAFYGPWPRAAQARLASHSQRTLCRVLMCLQKQLQQMLLALILALLQPNFQRTLFRVLMCPQQQLQQMLLAPILAPCPHGAQDTCQCKTQSPSRKNQTNSA